MSKPQDIYLTDDDLEAFANKLAAWKQELPAKEQALLGLMIDRMAGEADEELSDDQLESVAGGTMIGSFGNRTFHAFSKVLKRESFDFKKGMYSIVAPDM